MTALTRIDPSVDASRQKDFATPFSKSFSGTLAAGTYQDITVPTGATRAVFECDGTFWAMSGSAAAASIPSGALADTDLKMNPTAKHVKGVATIGVIAAAEQLITVEFFKD